MAASNQRQISGSISAESRIEADEERREKKRKSCIDLLSKVLIFVIVIKLIDLLTLSKSDYRNDTEYYEFKSRKLTIEVMIFSLFLIGFRAFVKRMRDNQDENHHHLVGVTSTLPPTLDGPTLLGPSPAYSGPHPEVVIDAPPSFESAVGQSASNVNVNDEPPPKYEDCVLKV